MIQVLRHTVSMLVLFVALSWLPSCGFGTAVVARLGQGGSSDSTAEVKTYGLTRDPNIGGALPEPGQLVAGELVGGAVSFAADRVYAASWRSSVGEVVAAASVRGMTSRRLAAVVPMGLPAGDYKVEFAIDDGMAELSVPVGAAAPVADPVAVVDATKAWWVAQRDVLHATASADTDVERKARSLADLARLSGWLATFDGAVVGLDAASLRTLAELLQANSDLRAAEPGDSRVSVDLIAAQSAAAAAMADSGLTALAASGSVIAPQGAAAVLESLLPASLQLGGLVAVLTAYDRWTKALAQPCKPIDTLQVAAADGSPLVLRFTQPLPLRCQVSCSSLTVSDVGDSRVAVMAAALAAASARRSSVLPVVTTSLGSLAPGMPTTALTQLTDLAPSRLELVSQTSVAGLPALVLSAGSLRASQPVFQSGSLQVGLRIVEAQLGSASGASGVALDNSPPSELNLVVIQPGTFQMGSPQPINVSPYFNSATAQPVHSVTISQPFWVGKYEVTQGRYEEVMGSNPSYFQGASWANAANRPVEQVTWLNSVAYCDALTAQEAAAGRLPVGYEYRLPTEAEWEYCCRAGTTTEFHYGSALVCGQANFDFSYNTNSSCSNPGGVQTALVGSYAANAWGLYDMHGNVWEWCLDGWDGASSYPAGPVTDPYVLSSSGPNRVVRGGGWDNGSGVCRSAFRGGGIPSGAGINRGFRVVCAAVRE